MGGPGSGAPGVPRPYCRKTVEQRIKDSVNVDQHGCWIWQGSLNNVGYGILRVDNKSRSAHRVAYETFIGPIPPGLDLDHLCRVRRCANPAHLEPVTRLENLRRSPIWNGNATSCIHGHPFDEVNTRYERRGDRYCHTCRSTWRRLRDAMTPEQREARKAAGLPIVDLAAHFAEERAA